MCTAEARACLTTLVSSSRAVVNSSSSSGPAPSGQSSVSTVIASRPRSASRSARSSTARARPAASSTAGCRSLTVARSSVDVCVSACSRRAYTAGSAAVAHVLEVLPGREHVLQRAVVQVLGQPGPGARFGVGEIAEQARAVAREAGDRRHPRQLHVATARCSRRPARPSPRCATAPTTTVRRWRPWSRRWPRNRPPWPGPRRPRRPTAAAGSPRAPGSGIDQLIRMSAVQLWAELTPATRVSVPSAPASTSSATHIQRTGRDSAAARPPGQRGRPQRVTDHDQHRRRAVVRGRLPADDGDHEHEQDGAQQELHPHPAIGVPTRIENISGFACSSAIRSRSRIGQSSRPRRMASATAAARSETPSFS